MAQAITPNISEGRRRALDRRRAHSTQGAAGTPGGRTRSATSGSDSARHSELMHSAPINKSAASVATAPTPNRQSAVFGASSKGREASLARRRAMTSRGKVGIAVSAATERTRSQSEREHQHASGVSMPARTAEKGCGCDGRKGESSETRASASVLSTSAGASSRLVAKPKTAPPRRNIGQPEGRQLSMARRRMQAQLGRQAVVQTDRVRSPGQRARQLNPELTGRELAREVRSERSKNGGRGQKNSGPCGRQRPGASQAEDVSLKVGRSETASGQTVTGTLVGRSRRVTGDEPSTCRVITGTEYMAADIFREYCQTDAVPNPRKVALTKTAAGRAVTGTEVGRSQKVTGDEPGSCRRVTGNEYLPADQLSAFCGTEPAPAPAKITLTPTGRGRTVSGSNIDRPARVTGTEAGADRATTGTTYISPLRKQDDNGSIFKKVGTTSTFRGGQVTGVVVGRSARVTGDEPGSCRMITGDEYVGSEQYKQFCGVEPRAQAPKMALSQTSRGKTVTGTQTGRSGRVTGDEPGSCNAITGTPYAGVEAYQQFCAPQAAQSAPMPMRSRMNRATAVMPVMGSQRKMTEDRKVARDDLAGTPYVGEGQFAENRGLGAVPGNPDFPQPLDGVSWAATFSVTTPAREAQRARRQSGVTGTRYEQGNITGPFVMGEGKITGTEQFRFGASESQLGAPMAVLPEQTAAGDANDAPKSRITGEGIDTGLRITGDDWGRNDRVTGTEGRSAVRRNPTRRGPGMGGTSMMARRPAQEEKQHEVAPSRVTGSSGNTEKGALVTVSGGARG